jgi:hypothetical protein
MRHYELPKELEVRQGREAWTSLLSTQLFAQSNFFTVSKVMGEGGRGNHLGGGRGVGELFPSDIAHVVPAAAD